MDECDVTDLRLEKQEKLRREKRDKELANVAVSEECIECDVFIPIARQEATGGCDMCIDCQSREEQLNKQKGG